jgi:hypothetical protein
LKKLLEKLFCRKREKKMKRTIVLSLLVLLSIGIMLPFATNWSEASRNKVQRKHKKVKKYSRVWWKNYRAKLRRNRSLAGRRQALAARRKANQTADLKMAKVEQNTPTTINSPVAGWSGEPISPNGEAKYRLADSSGREIGSAQLSVVGAAMPQPEVMPAKMRDKILGGVSVSSLRRTVIDKMIREEGWIVNDYQREVSGKKVFVVVAQTNGGGAINSRLFYFTEVGGRIYSLSTNAPNDYSDKIAADSEQFIRKLQRGTSQAEDVTAAASIR